MMIVNLLYNQLVITKQLLTQLDQEDRVTDQEKREIEEEEARETEGRRGALQKKKRRGEEDRQWKEHIFSLIQQRDMENIG
jgi:hypothetical protein